MNYYVRRIAQAVFTFLVVMTISFVMYRLLPGGPIDALRAQLIQQATESGSGPDPERINELVELYTGIQPDAPIYVQYFNYVKGIVLHQDFGESIWRNEPVFDVLFKAMPWSVFVSFFALVIGFTSNVLLGAYMAYREGSKFDKFFSVLSSFLSAVPYYVGAVLMLAYIAYNLQLLPTGGRYSSDTVPGLNLPFMVSIVKHAVLPVATGVIVGFGSGALAMRGNAVRVLGADYLRVARLRGLSEFRIATRYVTRNAILPMYTNLMVGIAALFSSSIIMEQIFSYPGVGWYTLGALESRDYPLLMGIFLFYTAVTIAGILIADFTYGLIDPRANTGETERY